MVLITKEALVIHPKLSVYGGAEYLCLKTCMILQGLGFHVNLVSDTFKPSEAERLFGMGDVLSKCNNVPLPAPRRLEGILLPAGRLIYTISLAKFANSLKRTDYNLVVSTQSSIFAFPRTKLYHFVYELSDLFNYPMPLAKGARPKGRWPKRLYFRLLGVLYRGIAGSPKPNWFYVTGRKVLDGLRELGYENSSFFYPPARMLDLKLPKKPQVIQACRIAPEKRLEFMFDVARRLPDTQFYLIGKNLPGQLASNPGYSQKLLSTIPPNVRYFEDLIRNQLGLLEHSKVYFHTGLEKGILLILIEAMSAGCVLVVPEKSVAGEVVRASGVGYQYQTADEAAAILKLCLEGSTPWTPEEISRRAREIGPKGFERLIAKLGGVSSQIPEEQLVTKPD